MIYTDLTKLALNTAYKAHTGQLDRSGLPYIFHPYHLAEQMTDELTCAIALLHDVVEDTDVTLEELAKLFPPEVVEGVRLMTHTDDTDYFDYVRNIRGTVAEPVKRADLAHNSDLSRLDTVTEKDILRLEKYKRAVRILNGEE